MAELFLEDSPIRDQKLAADEEFLITRLAELYLEESTG
jgi:hypothetical protein